ncbi:arylsulfotransferase family protein [Salinicola salarius]|uniref:arylsulfotransferase family protein n=1 Tax=Salinicola salarius TaxID=430457 RepID=UPI0023E3F211|nr:arylsulfotransferase family protein [Salinicola salarius]MDF3919472.1 arylsulfotransferase family protein [Salinicola salarius]
MEPSKTPRQSPDRQDADSVTDKVFKTLSILAALVLVFVIGAFSVVTEIFPGPQIQHAYQAGQALYHQATDYSDVYKGDIWRTQRTDAKGVTQYAPQLARNGLTLYTTGTEPAAYLIDMNGKVVHEWRKPYSEAWPDGEGVPNPRPDEFIHFRNAQVQPNGDLIALYEGNGDTPYGYGLVKLDKDSNVIWRYAGRAHHQFAVAPDGKIYALIHGIFDDEIEGLDYLEPPRLEDSLVVLSPEGEELQRTRLLPVIHDSKYSELLENVPGIMVGDPIHANAVDYIDADKARNFAFGNEGDLLLSFRETSSIAVFDPRTQKLTWATRGPWIRQHDPDVLPSGDIVMFDNRGHYHTPEGESRILEFDPGTLQITWQYAGTAQHPLESEIRGDQHRLDNGNTLISESDGGRLVEVTREGEIAWEYLVPTRGGPNGDMIPIIGWSQRLDPGQFDDGFRQSLDLADTAPPDSSVSSHSPPSSDSAEDGKDGGSAPMARTTAP